MRGCFRLTLGPVRVQLALGNEVARLDSYFSSAVLTPGTHARPDFRLLAEEVGELSETLGALGPPRGYRAAAMRRGLYLEHGLLSPAHLEWTDDRSCVLIAPGLARATWTYFVKAALTRFAMGRGWAHVKAACVAVGDGGILITGEGKTTLLLAMREASPRVRFVSNTHVLVDDAGTLYGVHSNVRVRSAAAPSPFVPDGDAYFAPQSLFGPGALRSTVTIKALVHREVSPGPLRLVPAAAGPYQRRFVHSAYALRRYGLGNDLVHDWLDGDAAAATKLQCRDVALMSRTVERTPRFDASGDVREASSAETLAEFLEGVERSDRES
jgi:hypothetical protein